MEDIIFTIGANRLDIKDFSQSQLWRVVRLHGVYSISEPEAAETVCCREKTSWQKLWRNTA